MSFERSNMGMKFFNRDIPNLINSINRVSTSLEKIANQSDVSSSKSKEQHYYELLNNIVNHVSNCEDTSTTIKTLLNWDFSIDDLVEDFHFNRDEVLQAFQNMDDFDSVY